MAESKSGSFIVNNNTGSFTVSINADQLTEGQKTMSVQIRRDSVRGQVIGNLSAPITINDTSFTPAGTIVSQGCVPGTYTYRVTKANGTGGVYNEDTVNSTTCGYVAPPVYPVAGTILSQGCVQGTYTYRIVKADGSGGSVNEDTPNSVSCGYVAPTNPPAGTILSQGCVQGTYTYRVTKANGTGGTYNEDTPNSVSCGYVPPVNNATYTFSSIPSSINEGSSGTFNVTTTNVPNGTSLYWQASTRSGGPVDLGDFTSNAGSFTINNNSGSFTVSPRADRNTEGSESFTVVLRTTGGLNSPQVIATSNPVTINDTSIFVPDYTIYHRPDGITWIEGMPASRRNGDTFGVKVNIGRYIGPIRIQDLTTGYNQTFETDTNGYQVLTAYFSLPLGNHNIRVTFGDGYVRNFVVNVT